MTISVEETAPVAEGDEKQNGPSPAAASIPSIDEQVRIIKSCIEVPLERGQTWYLIDARWFKQWKRYVGFVMKYPDSGQESENPGPIDNSNIIKSGKTDTLKDNLMEEVDYVLLPEPVWNDLYSWYGSQHGQDPIARTVREHGLYVKDLKVEVYLTELKLCLNEDMEKYVLRQFSKTATLDDVISEIKTAFDISQDKDTRLWNKYMSNTYELLQDNKSSIQDSGIYDGQVLMLEQKHDDGTWPRQTRSGSVSGSSGFFSSSTESSSSTLASSPGGLSGGVSSYASSYSTFSGYNEEGRRRRTSSSGSVSNRAGQCGLSNLGNTCFMNSALQCLSNTTPLTKYFIADNYKHELNPQNPLGMRGEIAKAYADLMHHMWSGYNSFVSPRNFKMAVGRFAPQFSGYQQQDSHELLAFLLDGLHEDLNRVKKKPYVEIPEHDGRPDGELAKEAWANHQLRNNSIIVDFFHGLFKSTVVCPMCDKISVTFDPFCYLSLPLPVNKERSINITFVPLETTSLPISMKVNVPKIGTTKDLTDAVSKMTNVDSLKLVVADVYTHRFHKIFERRDSLSHITDRDDIYVYEIPISVTEYKDSDLIIIPTYLRSKKLSSSSSFSSYGGGATLFGIPMLIPVPRKGINYDDLYHIMLQALRRVVKNPTDEEVSTEDINGSAVDSDEEKIKDDNLGKESPNKDTSMETEESKEIESVERIFKITSVNAYGSSDLDTFDDDDTLLNLSSKTYLALDWETKAKKKYFNADAAEETEQHSSMQREALKRKSIQLQDCLELFLTKEKLGADDPWYCPTCKIHQQASKKFDLWGLPTVLVIHLKRFSYNRWWRDKLDTLVEFPIRDLNLTPYVFDKNHPAAVYDLHAVSNHYGGLGGGHYTAYAKNCHDGKWYYYDDSSVSLADESQIVSKAAYVLFYTRRSDPTHPPLAVNDLLSDDESGIFPSQDFPSDDEDDSMQ
eukprot:gene7084-7884_t